MIMDTISREQFLGLANVKSDRCITIYMPTHRSGFEVNEKQDRLLYKNILKNVEKQVLDSGGDKADIQQLLKPSYELLDDKEFWYKLDYGLALFITADSFLVKKLPISIKEEVYVNNTFYLTPIFPLLNNDIHFYVLAISKNATAFYRGTAFSIEELSIEGLPRGMDDVIHFEEKSGQRLFRAGGSPATGIGSAHGHDAGLADEEEYVAAYLKEVDQTLWKEKLGNEKAPLLLAGVAYMAAKYRQISRYGNIVPEYLAGNYERVDTHIIFEKSRNMMIPFLQKPVRSALANYYNNLGGGTSCDDFSKVITASFFGQVENLFVKERSHAWGKFDKDRNQVTLHTEKEYGDECLVNQAIIHTIQNGGNIYVLSEEEMPDAKLLVASLRY